MDPYLSANKKSFENSLNWRNSGDMYTVGHLWYHGGLSTEVFFKNSFLVAEMKFENLFFFGNKNESGKKRWYLLSVFLQKNVRDW